MTLKLNEIAVGVCLVFQMPYPLPEVIENINELDSNQLASKKHVCCMHLFFFKALIYKRGEDIQASIIKEALL